MGRGWSRTLARHHCCPAGRTVSQQRTKNWDIELTALKSQSALCGEREHVTDLPPFSAHRIIRLALHRNGRCPLPFRGDTFGVACSFSLSVHSNPHRCSMVGMAMACRSTRPLWARCQMHSSGSAPKAYSVADLWVALGARCFGPESWSPRIAALRNQTLLLQWQEPVPRNLV
jgi:hypothetical protein